MYSKETFEKADMEFSIITSGLEKELYLAQIALWKVEGDLVAFGHILASVGDFKTLRIATEKSLTKWRNIL